MHLQLGGPVLKYHYSLKFWRTLYEVSQHWTSSSCWLASIPQPADSYYFAVDTVDDMENWTLLWPLVPGMSKLFSAFKAENNLIKRPPLFFSELAWFKIGIEALSETKLLDKARIDKSGLGYFGKKAPTKSAEYMVRALRPKQLL